MVRSISELTSLTGESYRQFIRILLTGDRPITGLPTQNTDIKKANITRILPILNHLKSVFTQSFPVSLR